MSKRKQWLLYGATGYTGRHIAEKAVAKEPENGPILDTLAHLLFIQGNVARAIELQTKAIKTSPEEMKEDMKAFLEEMKEKKVGK